MSTWLRAVRAALLGSALLALPLAAAAGGWHGGHGGWHGHGGTNVVIGVGPWWGGPYYYGGYYGYGPPAPYYYVPQPYYVYAPAPVVVEPPVYVERQPAPAPSAAAPSYWYYCESAGGYYPDVPTCPEPWVPVPPRAE